MRFLLPLLAVFALAPSHVSAGLRDVAGRLRIGVAGDFADPAERWDIATKEFNSVTAENACKPDAIQGQRGVFNFARCDSLYNKAKAAGMAFRGHTGIIWHGSDGGPGQNPGWLQQLSDDDKLREMVNHITRVIAHYPDAYAWDVVNEALCGENNSFCSRFFPNQRKEEFVAAAFRAARAAAPPGVKLFLNDFGHEFMGSGDGMFNFIVKLRSQGVPIDGVGMQSHFNSDANIASMRQNIERYHNAGIEIHITEIDVGAQNGDFTTQARIFNDVLKACLAFQRCTSYTIWGITDERSWRGSADQCLMWKNFQPKAAYNAVYETLRTQNAPPPPTPTSGGSAIAWKKASYLVFDVPAGNNENGQKVEVWGTGGPAPNQLFSLTACGNIKWTNTDKCLDVAGGVDANGVAIQLWQCSCQNPNQLWEWLPSGLLRWRSHNRCIDVIGGVVQSGTFLQIYDCSDDNVNQQFIAVGAPAPPPPPPAPQAPQGGNNPSNVFGIQWLGNTPMVVDVPNARNENGIRPQLYTSFGPGVAQRFQWSACGQLQWVGTDKCLDVASGTIGSYPNGTPIQMYTCWCGGANQLFQRDGNAIKIAGTNKCLDTGAGSTNGLGALLQIWECYDGMNQKFQLTSTSQQFTQSALSDTVAPYLDPTNVKLDWDVNTVVFVASGSRIAFDTTGCMSSIHRVSEDAFNTCNLTDSKITPYPLMASNSTAIMTLTAATSGDIYVMCGSSSGCLAGQRQHIVAGVLSVNGTSSSSGSRSTNGASSSHSSISPIMIGLVPLILTYLIPRLSL